MTEGSPDDVPLPHPDQVVDDQPVGHVGGQAAGERTRPPSPLPRPHDQVGVRDAWLPENPAPSVTRAARPGAGRGLEIVREAPDDASFHEARGARGDAFVVQGSRSGAARHQGVVGDGEPRIERRLAHSVGEG